MWLMKCKTIILIYLTSDSLLNADVDEKSTSGGLSVRPETSTAAAAARIFIYVFMIAWLDLDLLLYSKTVFV